MAREKRRGGGGGKILSFFLGILMGVILIVGSVVGVGYYVYTQPISDTLETIDTLTNSDLYSLVFGDDGILSADYADKKVGELLGDVTDAVSALSDGGSLADLDKTFPIIGKQIDEIVAALPKVLQSVLTKDDLMNSPLLEIGHVMEEKLYAAPLHTLLDLKNKPKEQQDAMLLALCFGEKGVDWDYDENDEIQMIGDAKETTLSLLTESTGFSELLYRLSLHSLLGKDLNLNDDIMRTLAFGPKTHYTPIYDTNDATKIVDVTMNEVVYNYEELVAGEGEKLYDIDGNEIAAYDAEAKTGYDASAGTVTLASGEVHYLDADYKAYTTAEKTERALYKKTTVKDLTQKASSLIDGVELGSVLNVNNESHKVLIALAYGSEENYTVDEETGKITPSDENAPRTVGDLKKDSKNIINDVLLGDALDVTPKSHKILIALAYGKEGVDYEIVDENGTQKIKPKTGDGAKAPSTIGDLTTNSNDLMNGIYLKDALTINASSHKVLISLAYGNDYTIVDKTDAEGNPYREIEGGTPRTLGELSENSTALINDIRLSDVLTETQDSAITMYLLYGKKGIHYALVDSGAVDEHGAPIMNTQLLPERILYDPISDKVYNGYGEELTGYSVLGETLTIVSSEEEPITKPLKRQGFTQTIAAGEAEVYYILKDENVTTGDDIYVLYEPTTIGSLNTEGTISNINNRLTLGELIPNVGNNFILKHLQNETIANLSTAVQALTLQEVYADQIYVTYTGEEKTDDNGHALKEGDFIDASGNFICAKGAYTKDLDDSLKAKLQLKGTWKYLLTDTEEGSPTYGKEKEYPIADMDKLVTNMTKNMQNATLSDLNTDGIITITSTNLQKPLIDTLSVDVGGTKYTVPIPGYKVPTKPDPEDPDGPEIPKTIGDLTITELFDYVFTILNAFSPAS